MTPRNEQSVANAPIKPTPRAKWGVKLHGFKFDFYADPVKKDVLMLAWKECGSNDVAHCANEDEFIEVMRALYARLSTEAHKRAAETEEQTG
jgi:hypothetical protein